MKIENENLLNFVDDQTNSDTSMDKTETRTEVQYRKNNTVYMFCCTGLEKGRGSVYVVAYLLQYYTVLYRRF